MCDRRLTYLLLGLRYLSLVGGGSESMQVLSRVILMDRLRDRLLPDKSM